MIRVEALTVRFGDVLALPAISFTVTPGERLGLRGPNGCGKSTLLRVLAGFLPPTAGRVEGAPPPGRTVLVHQRPYLFRGTAEENVAYALPRSLRRTGRAREWLDRLGAAHLAARRTRDLSGGERRRVAIARALAAGPEVLLLDEPFAALDAEGSSRLAALLATSAPTLVVAAPDLGPAPVTRTLAMPGSAPTIPGP